MIRESIARWALPLDPSEPSVRGAARETAGDEEMLRFYAVLALSLGSVISVHDPPAVNLDGSTRSSHPSVVQEANPDRAADLEEGAPPIGGMQGQIIFFAFLIVILIVPFIMAREPSDVDPPSTKPGFADAGSGSRFSSDRERRLWLWTVVVLVAIYSTLGPAAELAAALRERNLLRVTSAAVLLLVVAVIAVPWARRRPGLREIGAVIGIAAVYLATMIRIPVLEARSHLFEYGLVAILIYHALIERRRNGRQVPVPALIAAAATALLGWIDEGIQAFLPNRTYDIVDVGLNAIFGLMAIVASVFMAWARSLDILKRLRRGGPRLP